MLTSANYNDAKCFRTIIITSSLTSTPPLCKRSRNRDSMSTCSNGLSEKTIIKQKEKGRIVSECFDYYISSSRNTSTLLSSKNNPFDSYDCKNTSTTTQLTLLLLSAADSHSLAIVFYSKARNKKDILRIRFRFFILIPNDIYNVCPSSIHDWWSTVGRNHNQRLLSRCIRRHCVTKVERLNFVWISSKHLELKSVDIFERVWALALDRFLQINVTLLRV